MFFDDWKEQPRYQIPQRLLWEYDINGFTDKQWRNISVTVARRVIELGDKQDWYALMQLYGGPKKVARIVKRIPELNDIDRNFVKFAFNLKDSDLRCSIPKH